MSRSDRVFLEAFEAATLVEFHHRDHIRMTWLYLKRDGRARGTRRIIEGIRRFAGAKGVPAKYHETLTQLWIRLVAAALARHPRHRSFDGFAAAHPELLDKDWPLAFYRERTLMSDAARAAWVEPDVQSLP